MKHRYIHLLWNLYFPELPAFFYGLLIREKIFVGVAIEDTRIEKMKERLEKSIKR